MSRYVFPLTHLEVGCPHSERGSSIVICRVQQSLVGSDGNLVAGVGCRVLGRTVDGQRTLELRDVHLFIVGARLDEDDLLARGRSRESSNSFRDCVIELAGEIACSRRRCHLLVVYFCPLPTTSAPDGAVVRLAASAEAANAMRTLKTFMLTIATRHALTVVQRN